MLAAELPIDVRLMQFSASALYGVGAVLATALLLSWLMGRPLFGIHAIRIDGDVTRNSVSTIRANALPQLAGNYFTLDLARGKRAFESVPWVRQAIVRRIWPDRLAVTLEEHRAAALWAVPEGDDQLVNSQGEVFQANPGDVDDEALPTLQGPDGTAAQMLAMYRRLTPLFERLGSHIAVLDLSGRGSWRAELDSGAEVELGRGSDDELLARAQRFAATVSQVTARFDRPLIYADLRHNDGYALRLKGITTTTANPAAAARD